MCILTMNKDDLLTKYIFNELPASENEQLEDQLALDDELAERMQTLEMILIDRYVLDEMTAVDRNRFEKGFLLFPENLQKVEDARSFHQSLGQLKKDRLASRS